MQTGSSQLVFGYIHKCRNKCKLWGLEKENFLPVSKQCFLLCTSLETESLGFIMCCIYTERFNACGSGAQETQTTLCFSPSFLSISAQPSSISLQDQVEIFPLSYHVILRASSSGWSASVLMNDMLEVASCRGSSWRQHKTFNEQLCCAVNVISFCFFVLNI